MFTFTEEILPNGRVRRYTLQHDGTPMSYAAVLAHWQDEESFRTFFQSILAAVPFTAYRWETPPVTTATQDQAFECVLVDSPSLDRAPEPRPFARHFTDDDTHEGVVVFDNLGRDATLVVPSPRAPDVAYGHLAAFTRGAPMTQQHALWQAVGKTMDARLRAQPIWLSTAGGGVAWLHVRLDRRPKYYHYRPYAVSG